MSNMPEIPFYQMNINELRSYFIKINRGLERKRKTKRRSRDRRRKTARK
jgi:hypothetical protein